MRGIVNRYLGMYEQLYNKHARSQMTTDHWSGYLIPLAE